MSIAQFTLYTLTLLVLLLSQMMALPIPVGALRMPGFPLFIDVRNLTSKTSTEVCDELEKMVAFFESLQSEGFTIGETSRSKRVHSDRAGEQRELIAPYLARLLANRKTIHHSFTFCYDRQANGIAERTVASLNPWHQDPFAQLSWMNLVGHMLFAMPLCGSVSSVQHLTTQKEAFTFWHQSCCTSLRAS